MHDKNDALLRNPTSRTLHECFSFKRVTVQHELPLIENSQWVRKAAQIQSYAIINDPMNFYEALIGIYGPSRLTLHPVISIDGVIINNKELILARWAEYLQNLLNKVHTTDIGFLDDLPTLPIIPKLDYPHDVDEAILSLKDTKTAGPDNILLRSLIMVGVPYTEGCIILSLTVGLLSVSQSNGKCQHYSCIQAKE